VAYTAYDAFLSVIPQKSSDYYKNIIQETIDDQFDNAITFGMVQYRDSTTKELSNVDCRILSEKVSGIKLVDDFKQLLFQNFDVVYGVGDIFYFSDYYWIVYNTNNIASDTNKVKIRRCNYTLNWYNSVRTLIQEPVVLDYFKLSDDDTLIYGRNMIVGEGVRYILMQSTTDAMALRRDDRFIIENIAYKITSYDNTTKNGMTMLILEEHQVNDVTDDVANKVANKVVETNSGNELW
jgi:hypothetical protein